MDAGRIGLSGSVHDNFSNENTISYMQYCAWRKAKLEVTQMTTTGSSKNLVNDQPLQGLLVLDFSQFLSGPLATLRLADLGARVIKIERPGQGDLGRTLYLSDTDINGENTLFHAINRNKESLAADLKNPRDIEKLRRLIARADVMVQNFRPGVIERLKLDYETVAQTNPR